LASSEEEDEQKRFYANLATGLHAMAQPLTVLRSVTVASTFPGAAAADHQRYLEIAAEQVERACGLFHNLQQLLVASQMEAECESVDLTELLAPVVEDQVVSLQQSGVSFEAVIPEGLRLVLGDKDRTLQALFTALKMAASVSVSGDVVELCVTPVNGFIELAVRNRRALERRLNSTERLTLALAETNIRSQHGRFKFAEDPFCVSLALPVQKLDSMRSEQVSYRSHVSSIR
jgi:signal transduction histidine kinase